MRPRTYWLIILFLVAFIVGQCAELQCADHHTSANTSAALSAPGARR